MNISNQFSLISTLLLASLSACEIKNFAEFQKLAKKEFKVEVTTNAQDTECATEQVKLWANQYENLPRSERKILKAELSKRSTWHFESPTQTKTLTGETLNFSSSFESCSEDIECSKHCPSDSYGRENSFCLPSEETETCEKVTRCNTVDVGNLSLINDIKVSGNEPSMKASDSGTAFVIKPEQTKVFVKRRSAHTSNITLFHSIKNLEDYNQALGRGAIQESVDYKPYKQCGNLLPLSTLTNSALRSAYHREMTRLFFLKGDRKGLFVSNFSENWIYIDGSIAKTLTEINQGFVSNGHPAFQVSRVEAAVQEILKREGIRNTYNLRMRQVAEAIASTR